MRLHEKIGCCCYLESYAAAAPDLRQQGKEQSPFCCLAHFLPKSAFFLPKPAPRKRGREARNYNYHRLKLPQPRSSIESYPAGGLSCGLLGRVLCCRHYQHEVVSPRESYYHLPGNITVGKDLPKKPPLLVLSVSSRRPATSTRRKRGRFPFW